MSLVGTRRRTLDSNRKLNAGTDFDTLRIQARLTGERLQKEQDARICAGHGCGNQDVGPFEPRRRTHNLEQHIRARQASKGLKAEETQERSHTSLYRNTPAEDTSVR